MRKYIRNKKQMKFVKYETQMKSVNDMKPVKSVKYKAQIKYGGYHKNIYVYDTQHKINREEKYYNEKCAEYEIKEIFNDTKNEKKLYKCSGTYKKYVPSYYEITTITPLENKINVKKIQEYTEKKMEKCIICDSDGNMIHFGKIIVEKIYNETGMTIKLHRGKRELEVINCIPKNREICGKSVTEIIKKNINIYSIIGE